MILPNFYFYLFYPILLLMNDYCNLCSIFFREKIRTKLSKRFLLIRSVLFGCEAESGAINNYGCEAAAFLNATNNEYLLELGTTAANEAAALLLELLGKIKYQ
jgi:hypothetical protein